MIAVVTGANSGIGFEAALEFAKRGMEVVMAVRNQAKGEQARARILSTATGAKVTVRLLDLSDLESVKKFAVDLQQDYPAIDILVNNAGVMNVASQLTKQGFEYHFGVNYLGHYLLTRLLLPCLEAAADARVVSVTSFVARGARIDFSSLKGMANYNAYRAYRQSKLAMLLFSQEFERYLRAADKKTISLAAHPGYANTNLQKFGEKQMSPLWVLANNLIAHSAAKGAKPLIEAATAKDARGGEMYGPNILGVWGQPVKSAIFGSALDRELAARLWRESENFLEVYL
jgi:protochlorophyllide reductase